MDHLSRASESGVCCFDCYRGLFMFGKISFLLKGDPCAPVCRDVQVLPPVLGGGGRAKAENWF